MLLKFGYLMCVIKFDHIQSESQQGSSAIIQNDPQKTKSKLSEEFPKWPKVSDIFSIFSPLL